MDNDQLAFGRRLLECQLADQQLAESLQGKTSSFCELDSLSQVILTRAISGEKLAETSSKQNTRLLGIDQQQKAFIDATFALPIQQSKGAWFIDDQLKLQPGLLNQGFYTKSYPRYAMTLTIDERVSVESFGSATYICCWSLLEPIVGNAFSPLSLRGGESAVTDIQNRLKSFDAAAIYLKAISESSSYALELIGPGCGWGTLSSEAKIERKKSFLRRISEGLRDDASQRARLLLVRPLIDRYYAKAKSGPPTHRQVLTRGLQPILSGFFEGDWFRFLKYIEEPPSPDEQIHTTLPRQRPLLATGKKTFEVASVLGIPESQVKTVISAYWNDRFPDSPVEKRVEVLRQYWLEFDKIHSAQETGKPGLWGLVSEGESLDLEPPRQDGFPYLPALYGRLYSEQLNKDVSRLWGKVMLAEHPQIYLDCPVPHSLLAQAFGPALRFWHGCALTAWFLCEGPTSRTDMAGLSHYHRRELQFLLDIGCPVDEALFSDLTTAERRLGPPRSTSSQSSTTETPTGMFTLTLDFGAGQKREGFGILRAIVDRHRKSWADSFLETYITRKPEAEIGLFARKYSQALAQDGKPPSLKSVAKLARTPTNSWFGGEVELLYASIGEKLPEPVRYIHTLPANAREFVETVYQRLGGKDLPATNDPSYRSEAPRAYALRALAKLSLRFLEQRAISNRTPTADELCKLGFETWGKHISPDLKAAWETYSRICVECAEGSIGRQAN